MAVRSPFTLHHTHTHSHSHAHTCVHTRAHTHTLAPKHLPMTTHPHPKHLPMMTHPHPKPRALTPMTWLDRSPSNPDLKPQTLLLPTHP